MTRHFKFIYLDQYGPEFRQGYDVAHVINVMQELLKSFYLNKEIRKIFVNIHKDNVSLCEGLCAENLFHTEIKDPDKDANEKAADEVWIMITPSRMIKH